jgi:hypothetical protein
MTTSGQVSSAGPVLGRHNDEIYQGLLEKDAETLSRLSKDGII